MIDYSDEWGTSVIPDGVNDDHLISLLNYLFTKKEDKFFSSNPYAKEIIGQRQKIYLSTSFINEEFNAPRRKTILAYVRSIDPRGIDLCGLICNIFVDLEDLMVYLNGYMDKVLREFRKNINVQMNKHVDEKELLEYIKLNKFEPSIESSIYLLNKFIEIHYNRETFIVKEMIDHYHLCDKYLSNKETKIYFEKYKEFMKECIIDIAKLLNDTLKKLDSKSMSKFYYHIHTLYNSLYYFAKDKPFFDSETEGLYEQLFQPKFDLEIERRDFKNNCFFDVMLLQQNLARLKSQYKIDGIDIDLEKMTEEEIMFLFKVCLFHYKK